MEMTLEKLGYQKQSDVPLVYYNKVTKVSILISGVDVVKTFLNSVIPLTHMEVIAIADLLMDDPHLSWTV